MDIYKIEAKKKVEDTNMFYEHSVFCVNCKLSDRLWFKKGISISSHSCPNCNCDKLISN